MIDTKLEDLEFREKVLLAISKNKKYKGKKGNTSTNNEDLEGAFPSTFAVDFSLCTSWIIDPGSSLHVCNNTMQGRYTAEQTRDEKIAAGDSHLHVESVDSIVITLQSPARLKKIKLTNVHYVPDFPINLISASILAEKALYFDTQHKRLHINGITKFFAPRHGWHYLLENNMATQPTSAGSKEAFPTDNQAIKMGTKAEWHKILAHAGNDAYSTPYRCT